uniref:Uncharacterized protein n=1 Tax=Romanomermis culicivorax TaxID=13658 RepID=A0A915HFJ1_ROMCU
MSLGAAQQELAPCAPTVIQAPQMPMLGIVKSIIPFLYVFCQQRKTAPPERKEASFANNELNAILQKAVFNIADIKVGQS